jgi:hypothetical protein
MDMDVNFSSMVISIVGNIMKENFMVMENMYGKMEQCMKGNLSMDKEMGLENGNLVEMSMIYLLVSIKMIKNQEGGSIFGVMAVYMMVILIMTKKMEKVEWCIRMVGKLEVSGRKENLQKCML